jgi:hypothetical protein
MSNLTDPGNYVRILRSDALDKAITLYHTRPVPILEVLKTAEAIAAWLDKGDAPR